MPGRTAIIFFEMSMLIGDMFDAFLKKRGSWNFPSYFVTVTSDEQQHEWWMHTKCNFLKGMHLEGKLNVAGHNPLPEQIPSDVLEQPPCEARAWQICVHRA